MARLPVPSYAARPSIRLNYPTNATTIPGLQGSAMPGSAGGVVTSGVTYREVVAVAQAARVRVRLLTVTATGTLNVKPVAPVAATNDESVMAASGVIDPTKVTAYSTGTGTAAVLAATEVKVDVDLYGENYVLIEFVCTLTGVLTFCDVSQV